MNVFASGPSMCSRVAMMTPLWTESKAFAMSVSMIVSVQGFPVLALCHASYINAASVATCC